MSRDRQAKKAERSRNKLLEAAARLFSEKTIDEVGVREIAAQAGVTTGTFYHYFTGKDDILDKIYLNHDKEFGDILRDFTGQPGLYCEKILHFFVHVLAETVAADGAEFTRHRLFQMKKQSTDENLLYVEMKGLIEKALEAGELKPEFSVAEINDYLFLVFRGITYEWCICPPEERFSLPDRVKSTMRFALQSFR